MVTNGVLPCTLVSLFLKSVLVSLHLKEAIVFWILCKMISSRFEMLQFKSANNKVFHKVREIILHLLFMYLRGEDTLSREATGKMIFLPSEKGVHSKRNELQILSF